MAVCRLKDQCDARGHSGAEGEIWIERCVGVLTRTIGHTTPENPEKLMARRLALDDAIVEIANDAPGGLQNLSFELPKHLRDR